MEIIYNAEGFNRKNIVALGDFDGVHIGHKKLIETAVALAKERQESSMVYTFDQSIKDAKKITLNEEKEELLQAMGIDYLYFQKANEEFFKTSPEAFVENVIKAKLNASVVIVGKDYTFGYKGAGKSDDLERLCQEKGIETVILPLVETEDFLVSSSNIRFLIESGEMKKANTLLGRSFSVTGVAEKGMQLGRDLGFPTINISFDSEKIVPRYGVYFINAYIMGKEYKGIANVGIKPTVGAKKVTAEANLFDFHNKGELYGETVRIDFLYFERQEYEFENLELLKTQINEDKKTAISFFQGEINGKNTI